MANADGDCFIQVNRMQINENVMYFQATKAKYMEMFRLLEDDLGVQQFLTFGVKLTAMLPFEEPGGAASFFESKVFNVGGRQWDLLGNGRQGAGMRIVLHQDGVRDLRIEPLFNDTSQLYVELDTQYGEPFTGLSDIDARLEDAYTFMFSNVKDFIGSMR